jgi:hypothetical protein
MIFLVLGFVILILLLVLLGWLSKATPENVMKFAKIIGGGLLILAVLASVFSGKILAGLPMLAGAWIAFRRYRTAKFYWDMAQNWSNWSQSQQGQNGGQGGAPSSHNNSMSREEALHILGLKEGVSDLEIKAAYTRLMQKLHPDHGGTNYLASKLNDAKETLLGK